MVSDDVIGAELMLSKEAWATLTLDHHLPRPPQSLMSRPRNVKDPESGETTTSFVYPVKSLLTGIHKPSAESAGIGSFGPGSADEIPQHGGERKETVISDIEGASGTRAGIAFPNRRSSLRRLPCQAIPQRTTS